MVKIGFDIHGVIDANPEMFSRLTHNIIENGDEVHILTGSHASVGLFQQLSDWNIKYTTLFSITDWAEAYQLNDGSLEDPDIEPIIWDSRKAVYCESVGIDLLIDDTPVYGKYLSDKTTFIFYDKSVINTDLHVSSTIMYYLSGDVDKYKDEIRRAILNSDIYDLASETWANLTDHDVPRSMLDSLIDSICEAVNE